MAEAEEQELIAENEALQRELARYEMLVEQLRKEIDELEDVLVERESTPRGRAT